MNNKKQQAQTFLGLALLGGLMVVAGSAQAGAFMTPTTNAAGWGRAFGGGSLFKNDPSSAYNNPAAMAFIDKNISQFTLKETLKKTSRFWQNTRIPPAEFPHEADDLR